MLSSAATATSFPVSAPSQNVHHHEDDEWPALSPNKDNTTATTTTTENDWELLPEAPPLDDEVQREVMIEKESVVRIVEPLKELKEIKLNPRILKHCQSSPDLRQYVLEESDADDDSTSGVDESSSAVIVDNGDLTSLASSSIVMVMSPSTDPTGPVVSPWSSSKLSFSDVLKKNRYHHHNKGSELKKLDDQLQPKDHQHHTRIRKLKKPTFEVKPIKRCVRSSGDLTSLDDDDEDDELILGETDAQLYYNQKAQGKLGRKNGRKIRPDEAKRLEITMAKKTMQRQNQKR